MGSTELGGRARQAEQRARQVGAERRYLADVARTLDVCAYSAARGKDVGSFLHLDAMMGHRRRRTA